MTRFWVSKKFLPIPQVAEGTSIIDVSRTSRTIDLNVSLDYQDGTGRVDTFLLAYPTSKYGELPSPKRDGYKFVGWAGSDGNVVDPDSNCKWTATRLYAVWEERTSVDVYYHGPYGSHYDTTIVVGTVVDGEYPESVSSAPWMFVIEFNGAQEVGGFTGTVTFSSGGSPSDGYSGSFDEYEHGCFNFWSYNGGYGPDIYIKIDTE